MFAESNIGGFPVQPRKGPEFGRNRSPNRLLLRVFSGAGRIQEMTLIRSSSERSRGLPLSLKAWEIISLGVRWKVPMRVLY